MKDKEIIVIKARKLDISDVTLYKMLYDTIFKSRPYTNDFTPINGYREGATESDK